MKEKELKKLTKKERVVMFDYFFLLLIFLKIYKYNENVTCMQ